MKTPVKKSRKGMEYKRRPPMSPKKKKQEQRKREKKEQRKKQKFSDKITHNFIEQEFGLVASAVIRVSREIVGQRQKWNITNFVFMYGDRVIRGTNRDELVEAINTIVNTFNGVTVELWDARHVDAKINLRKIVKEAVGLERYEGDEPDYDLIDPYVMLENRYNPNLQFILSLKNNVTKAMEKEGEGTRMFLNVSDIRNHLSKNRTENDLIAYWEEQGMLNSTSHVDQSVKLSKSILLTFKKLDDLYTLPDKEGEPKSCLALTLGKTGFNLARLLGSFDEVDEVPRRINNFVIDMNLGGTLQAYGPGKYDKLYRYDIHGSYPSVERRFRYSDPSTFSEVHTLARTPELLAESIRKGQRVPIDGIKFRHKDVEKMYFNMDEGMKVQVDHLVKKRNWRFKHAVLHVLGISDKVTARNYLVASKYHLPKSVKRTAIQVKTRYAQGSFESGTECLNAERVLTTGLEFLDIYNQVKETDGAWIKITAVYQFKNMDFWGDYPDHIAKWKNSKDWLIKESAKLVGNTAHGYILMKAKDAFELDSSELVRSADGNWLNLLELRQLVRDRGEPIIGKLLSDGSRLNVYENLNEQKYDFGKHYYYPALIGAEVIGYARHVLWEHAKRCIEAIGYKHILYVNTDCIISDVPLDEYLPISTKMGDFSRDVGRGEIIGLGTYWMEIEKDDGTTEIDLKIEGVSNLVRTTDEQKRKIINGEDFAIIRDETVKRPLPREIHMSNLDRYRIEPEKRKYSLIYKEIDGRYMGFPRYHNGLLKKLPDNKNYDPDRPRPTYYETTKNGQTVKHLVLDSDSYYKDEKGRIVLLPYRNNNDELFRNEH